MPPFTVIICGSLFIMLMGVVILKKLARNPYYDPGKKHHTINGFANAHDYKITHLSALKWQFGRMRNRQPKKSALKITTITPNLSYLHSGHHDISATWIGHATVLLQLDGLNILTDPVFGKHISPIPFLGPKRHQAPGVALNQLPHIDVVVISHNHYDHLDLGSVRGLQKQATGAPKFYVPLGLEVWFKKNVPGAQVAGPQKNVFAFDWQDEIEIRSATNNTKFVFLPVQHWSARGLFDRNKSLWGSWAILNDKFKFWFSGDLGYSSDTVEIGRKFGGFDLAAIAIGAYDPRWLMANSHINPAEAVQVMLDIKAKQAFGIHWGTFEKLTDEPIDQPPKDLAAAIAAKNLSAQDFYTMHHGETRKYTKTTTKDS